MRSAACPPLADPLPTSHGLLLGHSSATITDAIYAERDLSKVEQAVLETG